MKKLLLFISICIYNLSHAQQLNEYQVSGRITNGISKGKAYVRYWGSQGPHFDSARIVNGSFVVKGKTPGTLIIARLFVREENETQQKNENSAEILLEPISISLTADQNLRKPRYSGSQLQQQFTELQSSLADVRKKGFELDEQYTKAEEEKNDAVKDKLLNEEYPKYFLEKQKLLGAFIMKYPASVVSGLIFEEFVGDGEMDLKIVQPVFAKLDSSVRQLPRVIAVAERIEIARKTAIGKKALEFSQTDTSGNKVSLSSYLGKYVLIDFWAGWCVPCRAENPLLKRLYELYRPKGFDILGVSLDGEREAWTKAIVTDKLVWKQVSDIQIFENAVAKLYGITSIPQNILVNPYGIIIGKNLRGSALEKKLETIFKD